MKKRKLLNLGMILISVFIVLSGLLAAGMVKGWFSGTDTLSVSHRSGIVTVERSGLAYQVKEGNALHIGDVISTKTFASLGISIEETPFLWLTDASEIAIENETPASFQVAKGETFTDARELEKEVRERFADVELTAEQAVWSVSVQSGASTVCVYAGKVEVAGADEVESVAAGQQLSVVKTTEGKAEVTLRDMSATALNDFQMNRLLEAKMDGSFCFTEEELGEVKQKRESEKLRAQQAELLADNAAKTDKEKEEETTETETEEDDWKEKRFTIHKSKGTSAQNDTQNADGSSTVRDDTQTEKAREQEASKQQQESEEQEASEQSEESGQQEISKQPEESEASEEAKQPEVTTNPEESDTSEKQPETQALYCTIEIRCDTILNNMGALSAEKEACVPSDGTVLAVSKIAFTQGETAFDVLKRACDLAGIQIEYSYTPMYKSYYVEGIQQLYEFDCGSESGWMYKVNGWFPNYGCSGYTVKEGDEIVFCYTCNGLGADVGGSNY